MISSHISTTRQLLLGSFMLMTACAPSQFTTHTVYDSPHSFVRLEVDRTLDRDTKHNHPLNLSSEQMAALLNGLVYEEPVAKLPFYDDFNKPRRHPALSEQEITLLAPLLALALKKAGPDEIVTFYHATPRSTTQRVVTSGGIVVDGENLRLVLANYRSPTHFSADPGVADTMDERLTPLRSIAPQRGRVELEPASWAEVPTDWAVIDWFQPKQHEVVVPYKLIQAPTTSQPAPTTSP